jgi:hypothetical protein
MACKCVTLVNEKLAARNTRLVTTMSLTDPEIDYPKLQTERIELGRNKPKAVLMVPCYCPFCGTIYKAEG